MQSADTPTEYLMGIHPMEEEAEQLYEEPDDDIKEILTAKKRDTQLDRETLGINYKLESTHRVQNSQGCISKYLGFCNHQYAPDHFILWQDPTHLNML